MVGVPEAYDLVSPSDAPGDLEGGLIGLGATVAEKSLCEVFVCDLGKTLREMDLGLVEEGVLRVVDYLHLFFYGLDDLGVLDSEVDVEQL